MGWVVCGGGGGWCEVGCWACVWGGGEWVCFGVACLGGGAMFKYSW